MTEGVERLLLRPMEAGEALGMSRTRIYSAIADGSIRTVFIGHRIRVPADEVRRVAAEGLPAASLAAR